jgi:hypothetical protein
MAETITPALKRVRHDDFFRFVFAVMTFAKAFLRAYLPQSSLSSLEIENLQIDSGDFIASDGKTTHADIVYIIPIKGSDKLFRVYILLEHKSYDDPKVIVQLADYVHQKSRNELDSAEHRGDFLLSPVIPFIVYQGENPFSSPSELAETYRQIPGLSEYLPHLKAIVVDLSVIPAEELPQDTEALELKPMLRMMQIAFEKANWAEHCVSELDIFKTAENKDQYTGLIHNSYLYTTSSHQGKGDTMTYNAGVDKIASKIEEIYDKEDDEEIRPISEEDAIYLEKANRRIAEISAMFRRIEAKAKIKEEAKAEGKAEVAHSLKKMGMPFQTIAQATGLSLETIEAL